MNEVELLRQELEQFKAEYYKDRNTTEDVFRRNLALLDVDLKFGTTTGTKIGTSATQKLAFYGSTPVVQQANIADPSGGATQDAEARTAIGLILDRLDTYGLTA